MRRAAPALALLLVLAWPQVAAQSPSILPADGPYQDSLVLVSVDVLTPPQEVGLNGQVRYDIRVEDLSADQPQQELVGVFHSIYLDIEVNRTGGQGEGWNAFLANTFFSPSFGGDVFETFAMVQASPQVQGQYFKFDVRATLISSTGQQVEDTAEVATRLRPFSLAAVDIRAAPPNVGPFQDAFIPVEIQNGGQYPDTFLIEATGPEGWLVSVQPRLTLWPGETGSVVVQVVTPATRVFVPQETGIITVQVRSVLDPGVVYERASIVTLEGVYLPGYWAPLVVLGAALAGGLGRRAVEDGRRRAKEQGKPAPPRLSPAQRVLMAELKHRDPERHRALSAAHRRAFRARVRAFGSVRKRRADLERALVERQHAQVRSAKAEERLRQREALALERELERRRAALEAEKQRAARAAEAERVREERRRVAEERRLARLEAPKRRAEERARLARERKLRAELARRKRLLAVEERKARAEKERRARLLARRKKELERRAKRSQPKPAKPKRGRKGRAAEEGEAPSGGSGGGEGPPGA